ncbi:MAG TPA: large conductance mechanosensitive channel protein MscL [Acidimicrobiales bacterium]|nr:large conductance mechanosensitive channel protein MscL [Acidimicrobiales bacterium]
MLKDFKAFILRGSIIDLAVAVIVGVAFTAVVTALVKDLITPLISAIGGQPDFSNLSFTIHHSVFLYGDFLNSLISFLIEATAVFFLVVVPLTKFMTRLNLLPAPKPAPPTKDCPECLSAIPVAARRCAFCTSELSDA